MRIEKFFDKDEIKDYYIVEHLMDTGKLYTVELYVTQDIEEIDQKKLLEEFDKQDDIEVLKVINGTFEDEDPDYVLFNKNRKKRKELKLSEVNLDGSKVCEIITFMDDSI